MLNFKSFLHNEVTAHNYFTTTCLFVHVINIVKFDLMVPFCGMLLLIVTLLFSNDVNIENMIKFSGLFSFYMC